MKKPTPETDAVAAYEGNWDTKALRMTAHSRKLERERDEAREKAERYRIEANSIMLQRDEARSLTEHQWLLKVGSRLFVAKCKSDGIIDSLDEIIRERDELREVLKKCREDSICYAEHMRKCGYAEAYKESKENADRATRILEEVK